MLSTADTVLLASAVTHVTEARNAAELRGDSASVDHLNLALIALSVVEANGTGTVSYRVRVS